MKELIKLDKNQSILRAKQLLEEFDQDFQSSKVDELREIFPRYVALYTKFIYKPDIVVRGINPSYFSTSKVGNLNTEEEDRIVLALKGVHELNAYTEYTKPRYHCSLVKDIRKIRGKNYLDESLMGWNDCFIQSPGQDGMGFLNKEAKRIDKKNENTFCLDLIKKSKLIAKKLEYLVKPKLIIYAGRDSGLNNGWDRRIPLYQMKKDTKETMWGGKKIVVTHFSVMNDENRVPEIQALIDNLNL